MNFKQILLISFFIIVVNLQLNNGEEILSRKPRSLHLLLDHVSKFFGRKVNVLTGQSQFINKAPFIQKNSYRNENPTATIYNQVPTSSLLNFGANLDGNFQASGFDSQTKNNVPASTSGPSRFSLPLQTDAPIMSSTPAPAPAPVTFTNAPTLPPTTTEAPTTTHMSAAVTTDAQIPSTDFITEEPIPITTTTFGFNPSSTAANVEAQPQPEVVNRNNLETNNNVQSSFQFSAPGGYQQFSSNFVNSNKDYYHNQELYHPQPFGVSQYQFQAVPAYSAPQPYPISNNYIGNGQYSMSHSSVKMHDSPTNLVTYHSQYSSNPVQSNAQYQQSQYYGDY